ncbi:1-phosphofructokinase [Ornithinibacillus bavariensis]|uniref:Tagatose-6-phosphate kinase n=1 Tax=Ornithinibacillus bavariensis TaxID=545502 RepID=A0A919X6E9_9BACI|nr:1-phosphofructokinase [Ornithinibacillus bavariensis]GIO25410.1 tagatose-6-phosphate kinase [Ornithinibacillus bavariensis]HAM80514.1 1-phosphofructokinase [Ornithinibacillus sp.]
MIYTVTLNPSIDYIVNVSQVDLGKLNKMENDLKLPGGKGINVSRILHELGIPTKTLGFLGGFTGDFIKDWLINEGVESDFITIQDDTRINIKLKSKEETEINGRGPVISQEEANRLIQQLERLTENDLVILSGSKPPALPEDYYQQLVKVIKDSHANFIIDTTGEDLMASLPFHPLLVKPNKEELAELFQAEIASMDDVLGYGKKLLEIGAEHVIVSMAGEGAILFTRNGIFKGESPKGTVKNSVGAGDSMIAGFTGEYMQSKDPIKAFKLGIASGSATAFSDDLAKNNDILSLLNKVEVRPI